MATLADVAEIKGGLAKGKRRGKNEKLRDVPFLRVANVQAGYLDLGHMKFIEATEGEISKLMLRHGDVLFNEGGDRDKLGRGWVWEGQIPECIHQNHVFRARPRFDVIDPFFLSYWGNSQAAKEYFEEGGKQTVNLASISLSKLGGLPVPLPPLSEQNRIVKRLDTVLAKVEASQQRLKRIPFILKRFRQAVLNAACTGRLTNDWREEVSKEFAQQMEWVIRRADEICKIVQSGSTPAKGEFLYDGGIPFLKVYNIVDQEINFDQKPQYISESVHRGILKRSKVEPGDVIMNIVGPPLGKVAIVPNRFNEWNINQAIVLFRPKPDLNSQFLYLLLCSGIPYTETLKETRGSAGQVNISLSQCRGMELTLPPMREQVEIVRRVKSLFSLADRLEDRYSNAKVQADLLTQSILAKAFRGELVRAETGSDKP